MNHSRWHNAKLTRAAEARKVAERLSKSKVRYKSASSLTGVPWFVIAVIHQRESSGSFAGVLHNGQKIIGTGRKTTIVPKGRGPFASWEAAAVDALKNCHPYAANNRDWSVKGTLDLLERYNGLGYRNKGLPSPYLWAGTNQYQKGKYIADGKYDPNHVDKQLGCAAILMAMMETEEDVRAWAGVVTDDPVTPAPKPSLIATIVAVLAKLFRR